MFNLLYLTVILPVIGTLISSIYLPLSGITNLPSIQRRRFIGGLKMVSLNYASYLNFQRNLKRKLIFLPLWLSAFAALLLASAFLPEKLLPPGEIQADLIIFPILLAIGILIYLNGIGAYYLRKSIPALQEINDQDFLISVRLTKKGINSVECGFQKLSMDEVELKTESWKNSFLDMLWAMLSLRYQIIFWGIIIASLTVYLYSDLSGKLYFASSFNGTDMLYSLFITIPIIIFFYFVTKSLTKHLKQSLFKIYQAIFDDGQRPEIISVYTRFGEIEGVIDDIGNQFTLLQIIPNEDKTRPAQVKSISLSWKQILGVSSKMNLEKKIDCAFKLIQGKAEENWKISEMEINESKNKAK